MNDAQVYPNALEEARTANREFAELAKNLITDVS